MANIRVATGVKKTPIWVKFLQISFELMSDESRSAKEPIDQKSMHKERKTVDRTILITNIQMVMVTISSSQWKES